MGKKGSWFSIVKKTLSSDSKEKKEKKPQKSKKRWFGKQKNVDEAILVSEKAKAIIPDSTSSLPRPPPALKVVKLTEPTENEHSKLANTVVSATAKAAEAASAVFRFLHPAGKSTEEIAAIKIQAVFRGYMERKASRAWRGLVRLRLLIRGQSVQRQTNTTLRCMQTLARVQTQIRAKRIRLSKENQALQRQLQQKREKDIEVQRKHDKDIEQTGDSWENTAQSKEQVEANQQYKQEAAKRRERALAYAYSQQQTRNLSSRNTIQALIDPTTPSWGWSWLERWMTARPLETKCGSEKDAKSDCSPSLKSTPIRPVSVGQLSRANSCGDLNLDIKLSTSTTTSLKQSQGRLSSSNHNLDIKPSTSTTTYQKQSQGRLSSSNLDLGIKPFTSTTTSLKQSQGRLSSSSLDIDIKPSTSTTTSQKQSQGRLSSSNLDLDINPSTSTTTSLKQSQGQFSSSNLDLDIKSSTSTTTSQKQSQGRLSSSNLDLDIKPSTSTTSSLKQSQGRLSSSNLDLDIKPSTSTTSSTKQIQSRSRAATRNSFPHSKIAPVSSVTGLPTSRPRSQKSSEFDGDGDLSNPINESNRMNNFAESAMSKGESPGNLSRSPTRTPKSRTTRMPRPLGLKSGSRGASAVAEKPTGLLKKRISFSGRRKQSGSAKMDGGTLKDIRVDA